MVIGTIWIGFLMMNIDCAFWHNKTYTFCKYTVLTEINNINLRLDHVLDKFARSS